MTAMWVKDHAIRKWILPRPCEIFEKKYDSVQQQITRISCMDDLLSGECYVYITTVICIALYNLHVCNTKV